MTRVGALVASIIVECSMLHTCVKLGLCPGTRDDDHYYVVL